MKVVRMTEMCSMHEGDEKYLQKFNQKTWGYVTNWANMIQMG